MIPSEPRSNSLPLQVIREVKKLRHQTLQINRSRAGRSQRSEHRGRSPVNRCAKCNASRATTTLRKSDHAAIENEGTAMLRTMPSTANGKLKLKNIRR